VERAFEEHPGEISGMILEPIVMNIGMILPDPGYLEGLREITRRHVKAELAEVVTRKKPGRANGEQITLFKSVGWAPEDAATARLAYDRAMAQGIGTEVCL